MSSSSSDASPSWDDPRITVFIIWGIFIFVVFFCIPSKHLAHRLCRLIAVRCCGYEEESVPIVTNGWVGRFCKSVHHTIIWRCKLSLVRLLVGGGGGELSAVILNYTECEDHYYLPKPKLTSSCSSCILSSGRETVYDLLSPAKKLEIDSLRASHISFRMHPFSLVRVAYSVEFPLARGISTAIIFDVAS